MIQAAPITRVTPIAIIAALHARHTAVGAVIPAEDLEEEAVVEDNNTPEKIVNEKDLYVHALL